MITRVDDGNDWDRMCRQHGRHPLYGSSSWARYKQGQGWQSQALRWNGGQDDVLALVQTRRVGGWGPIITLIQGGPVGKGDLSVALSSLLRFANPGPFGLDVVMPAQATDDVLETVLRKIGFQAVDLSTSATLVLDLQAAEPERRQGLSKNWRHNLTRAEKRDQQIRWIGNTAAERRAAGDRMSALYAALTERKGFAQAVDPAALVAALGECPDIEWLEVWQGDTLMASRMAWLGGEMALDLLAASSDAAKTTYANYMALWNLIEKCRERGALRFDCGGIDPHGNVGVYNFKKGLGGTEALLGRFWLRSRPSLLTPLAVRFLAGRLS